MITAAASKYTDTRPIATKDAGKMPGATVATTLYANAAEVPSPISVHMFGLRLMTDFTPRSKNGQPAHSTIGEASTSSIQLCVPISNHCSRCPAIASTVTITVNGSVQ